MSPSPDRVVLDGFAPHGAESLAIKAGGLVFTGALTAAHLTVQDAGDEMASVLRAARQVLEAANCAPAQVGKAKLTVASVEDAPAALARVEQLCPAAATLAVGGRLPDPRAGLALECVGIAAGTPEPLRDARGQLVACRVGDLLFTAGHGPYEGEALVGAGHLGAQGRAALQSLSRTLALAGLSPAALLKINNTTACWHDYRQYNDAYNAVLTGTNAARCSVSGALRHPLALIEVEGVASLERAPRFVDSTWSGVGREGFDLRADTVYRPDLGPCKGPHSHGARAGDVVFVAGECPYDAEDRLVGPGDVAAQTLQTLANVRVSLEALGSGLGDVVKTTVTLADPRLAPGFEAAYASVFAPPYPARSLAATPLGQYGILVEIEAVAVVGAGQNRVAVVGRSAS